MNAVTGSPTLVILAAAPVAFVTLPLICTRESNGALHLPFVVPLYLMVLVVEPLPPFQTVVLVDWPVVEPAFAFVVDVPPAANAAGVHFEIVDTTLPAESGGDGSPLQVTLALSAAPAGKAIGTATLTAIATPAASAPTRIETFMRFPPQEWIG